MTKSELFALIRERGYTEPEFFTKLEDTEPATGTIQRIIQMMDSGHAEQAWKEIDRLHYEHVYFSLFDSVACEPI